MNILKSQFKLAKDYNCLIELDYKDKPLDKYISPLTYRMATSKRELNKQYE